MTVARQAVLALSNSEQQRETLVIMLDEAFDVTAAPSPIGRPLRPAPAAVVVAPSPWDEALPRLARRRWPDAGMVLVDAPHPVRGTLSASWADPQSVPCAVARVARPLGAARALEDETLIGALRRAEMALRPALEQAQCLAALAECAARPVSVAIAARLLGDHLMNLLDRFAWTEWRDDREGPAGELTAALIEAIAARQMRALLRQLPFAWRVEGDTRLACSSAQADVLARSLRGILLGLSPGVVSIAGDDTALRCFHPELGDALADDFAVAVLARLLRRAGAHLTLGEGALAIEVDDAADHA